MWNLPIWDKKIPYLHLYTIKKNLEKVTIHFFDFFKSYSYRKINATTV